MLARIHSLRIICATSSLLNRIDRALSNLKNIGQVNDVSAILRAQAENDEDQVASSYTLFERLGVGDSSAGFHRHSARL